ncbi:PadR family transcriptional regulator [Streptacidiphilus sp. PAMC 29251]
MSTTPRRSPIALTILSLLHYQPLHPYGVQRLIKQWGKDQVVNVSQRAGLYRTIDRLLSDGLIAVRETERDQQYPERTVYEITDAGRATTREWLLDMLATPKQEFPEFPAALSFILMLTPEESLDVLSQRARILQQRLAGIEATIAVETKHKLPRVTMLETDYQRAIAVAQLAWTDAVVDDLRSGKLSWTWEGLTEFAADADTGDDKGTDPGTDPAHPEA